MASARGAEAYRVAPKCGFSSGSTVGRSNRGGCCPSGTPPELRLHAAILSPLSIRSLLAPNSGDACSAPRTRAAALDGDEDRYRAPRHGVEAVWARRPSARRSADTARGADGCWSHVLRHRRRRAGRGAAARGVDERHPVGHRRRRPAGSLPLHRPGVAVRRAHHADARGRRPLPPSARHHDRRVSSPNSTCATSQWSATTGAARNSSSAPAAPIVSPTWSWSRVRPSTTTRPACPGGCCASTHRCPAAPS